MPTSSSLGVLFEPLQLGALRLPNRVLMAPLTRTRATDAHVPRPDPMGTYYAQRAGAGLIVSEGTAISPVGVPNPRVPAIWAPEHVTAWQPITERVHSAGGRIVCQLWHGGRMSHASLLPLRQQPVSASATTPAVPVFTAEGFQPAGQAHALSRDEIAATVSDYAAAAKNALAAGFDGVQIHAANGT